MKAKAEKANRNEYRAIIVNDADEVVWRGQRVATEANALRVAEDKLDRWELALLGNK